MTAPLTTRILLADDHPVVLRGLRMVLDAEPDLAVVAEAGDGARGGAAGARARASTSPSSTSRCPRLTGLQAAARAQAPAPRAADPHALDVRQRAVLLRGAEGRARRATCSRAPPTATSSRPAARPCAASRSSTPPPSRAHPRLPRPRRPRRGGADDPLTPRELEIVKLVAEGHTSDEIAEAARHQPRRPSSTTAATSSRSSGCATASSSRATRSAADWSSPEQWLTCRPST